MEQRGILASAHVIAQSLATIPMWPPLLVTVCLILTSPAFGFQIAPTGSKLEARLTNEPDSSLIRAAGRLGKLIKRPVHEEITQIGFDCPVQLDGLRNDVVCAGSDAGYAEAFVIYGVRWNDMPPFRLSPGQGSKCRKYGFLASPACNASQTVRFSTQPDCWLCLFSDAEKVAQTMHIAGCETGESYVQGTLMTRSHFGDLQFLHAMANTEGIPAAETQAKLLDWAQFAWRVFDGDFGPDTFLRDIDIPTIKQHFGCSSWTVSDIYILGAKNLLIKHLSDIAFGSIVHTVQDSFAEGHVERGPALSDDTCPGVTSATRPGPIIEFHAYAQQDGRKHDLRDERGAMVEAAQSYDDAIAATQQLASYWSENKKWAEVKPFFECIFALDPGNRPSSAGKGFGRD